MPSVLLQLLSINPDNDEMKITLEGDKIILEKVKNMLLNYRNKIMLPLDVIVANTYDENYLRTKKIRMGHLL